MDDETFLEGSNKNDDSCLQGPIAAASQDQWELCSLFSFLNEFAAVQ